MHSGPSGTNLIYNSTSAQLQLSSTQKTERNSFRILHFAVFLNSNEFRLSVLKDATWVGLCCKSARNHLRGIVFFYWQKLEPSFPELCAFNFKLLCVHLKIFGRSCSDVVPFSIIPNYINLNTRIPVHSSSFWTNLKFDSVWDLNLGGDLLFAVTSQFFLPHLNLSIFTTEVKEPLMTEQLF